MDALTIICHSAGDRTNRRRTICLGQVVADNSSQDNSSQTIRRGQLVEKYDINVTGDLQCFVNTPYPYIQQQQIIEYRKLYCQVSHNF